MHVKVRKALVQDLLLFFSYKMLMYRMPYIISLCQNTPCILILGPYHCFALCPFPQKLHPYLSILFDSVLMAVPTPLSVHCELGCPVLFKITTLA